MLTLRARAIKGRGMNELAHTDTGYHPFNFIGKTSAHRFVQDMASITMAPSILTGSSGCNPYCGMSWKASNEVMCGVRINLCSVLTLSMMPCGEPIVTSILVSNT